MVMATRFIPLLLLILPAWAQAADAPDLLYPQSFTVKEQKIPACVPLYVDVSHPRTARTNPGHAVSLRSRGWHWKPVFMTRDALDALNPASTFAECVRLAPDYSGLYTEEHLAALKAGRFVAGMPVDFVLAILGPPDTSSYVSTMNPLTKQPESFTTYVWDENKDNRRAAAILGIVSGLALGTAAVSSNLDTSIDSLRVGAGAIAAERVLLDFSALSRAKTVTVQMDDARRINMVMVQ